MRHVIRLKLSYAQHELKKLEHKGMLIDYLINAVLTAKKRVHRGHCMKDQLYSGSRL